MELKKVIKLLKSLPNEAGLIEPDNWSEGEETQQWRKDVIEALKFAVKALQDGEIVGTLNLDGKEYKITK